ncbi:MAG: hypothetical protein KBS60_02550, partial [Phascolarctobacterium sp.]|nr:hypothetical protein [Candidatus Phascolarctobacterium caballi]
DVYVNKYGGLSISVCNKLFKIEVLQNCRFDVNKTSEDVFFSLKWIQNTNRYGRICSPMYFYVQRDGSITHALKYSNKNLDIVEGYEKNLKLIKSYYPGAVSAAYIRLFWAYRVALERGYACVDKDEHLDVVYDLLQKIRVGWKFWLFNKDISFKAKVAYVLISLNVDLYMWVRKKMK